MCVCGCGRTRLHVGSHVAWHLVAAVVEDYELYDNQRSSTMMITHYAENAIQSEIISSSRRCEALRMR